MRIANCGLRIWANSELRTASPLIWTYRFLNQFLESTLTLTLTTSHSPYGSGFEVPVSAGAADPVAVAEPVAAGVAVAEPDCPAVDELAGVAAGFGFSCAESWSARFPASRDAIPAAMLSGKRCTTLS